MKDERNAYDLNGYFAAFTADIMKNKTNTIAVKIIYCTLMISINNIDVTAIITKR